MADFDESVTIGAGRSVDPFYSGGGAFVDIGGGNYEWVGGGGGIPDDSLGGLALDSRGLLTVVPKVPLPPPEPEADDEVSINAFLAPVIAPAAVPAVLPLLPILVVGAMFGGGLLAPKRDEPNVDEEVNIFGVVPPKKPPAQIVATPAPSPDWMSIIGESPYGFDFPTPSRPFQWLDRLLRWLRNPSGPADFSSKGPSTRTRSTAGSTAARASDIATVTVTGRRRDPFRLDSLAPELAPIPFEYPGLTPLRIPAAKPVPRTKDRPGLAPTRSPARRGLRYGFGTQPSGLTIPQDLDYFAFPMPQPIATPKPLPFDPVAPEIPNIVQPWSPPTGLPTAAPGPLGTSVPLGDPDPLRDPQPFAQPLPDRTGNCNCVDTKTKPDKRKPRQPRAQCKRGTYRQTARGIIYSPKETVPCQ